MRTPRTRSEEPKSRGIPAMEWTRYRVSWVGIGLTKLCGSVPSDPELVKAWLDARQPRVRPPGSRSLDEINEEVLATLAEDALEETESTLLTFQHHEGACVMRAATIKAHLKDCARRLSARVGKIEGEAAFSTKVINYVYPDPTVYWVPILRPDGTPVIKPDGAMDRPVTTRFGTSLKRFEWIEPWRLDFTLQVFTTSGKPAVGPEDLDKLMLYGGVHGYAGERGNGEGKYVANQLSSEEASHES
jgi:hypothetical protein